MNGRKVFNLDAVTMLDVLHEVEKMGAIKIIRTAGLDVIHINEQLIFDERVERLYKNINERTICDLLLHRKKVDGEVFNVAIQRYVQDPKKVTARLMKYAKLFHVEKKVREVLGVWL